MSDSGSGRGASLHSEFCGTCGSGILEFGGNAGDNTYITYGTLDEQGLEDLGPKGEFFCKYRRSWMPEIPVGDAMPWEFRVRADHDDGQTFQKMGIKEHTSAT